MDRLGWNRLVSLNWNVFRFKTTHSSKILINWLGLFSSKWAVLSTTNSSSSFSDLGDWYAYQYQHLQLTAFKLEFGFYKVIYVMNKKNDQSLHGKLKAGKSKRSKQLLKIQPTLERYIAGVYVLEPNKDLTSFSELSIK